MLPTAKRFMVLFKKLHVMALKVLLNNFRCMKTGDLNPETFMPEFTLSLSFDGIYVVGIYS